MRFKIEDGKGQFVTKDFENEKQALNYSEVYCKDWDEIEIQEVRSMKIYATFYRMETQKQQIKTKKGAKKKYKEVDVKKKLADYDRVFEGTEAELVEHLQAKAEALGSDEWGCRIDGEGSIAS